MSSLVVGGDGNIDKVSRRVGVSKSNDGDVDVRSLLDGLGIRTGVSYDNETGLLERAGNVVSEGTRGESSGNGSSADVRGELQDSTLAVRTSRDDDNVGRVWDGDEDTSGEDELLPVSRNVKINLLN